MGKRKLVIYSALFLLTVLVSLCLPFASAANTATNTWITETVDTTSGIMIGTGALRFDSNGTPHLHYWVRDDPVQRYATRSNSWSVEPFNYLSGQAPGPYTDKQWFVGGLGEFFYSSSGDQWYRTQVDDGWAAPCFLNRDGQPVIIYSHNNTETSNCELKYAVYDGENWLTGIIPTPAGVNASVSTWGFDSQYNVYIAYVDSYKTWDLHYLYSDGSTLKDEVVTAAGPVDQARIVVDPNGKVYIGYFDKVNSQLKCAIREGSNWQITTIADASDAFILHGAWFAIKLDPSSNHYPHMSYHNNGDLMYASWDGNAWTSQVVDTPGSGSIVNLWATEVTSLAFDQNGYAHIAYWQNDNLKYASETPTITGVVDLKPDSYNLKRQSGEMTAYIQLPAGYSANDIDVSTVRLNGAISALSKPTAIGDYNQDGIPDLMVKFHLPTTFQPLPDKFMEITLQVSGHLKDGTLFTGFDTLRVIST